MVVLVQVLDIEVDSFEWWRRRPEALFRARICDVGPQWYFRPRGATTRVIRQGAQTSSRARALLPSFGLKFDFNAAPPT